MDEPDYPIDIDAIDEDLWADYEAWCMEHNQRPTEQGFEKWRERYE